MAISHRDINASSVCYLVAVIIFVLAAFGAHPDMLRDVDLVAFGLAWFAAGHLL